MAKYGIKRYVKSAFNVGGWLGYRSLSDNASFIKNMFSNLLKQPDKDLIVSESFEEAQLRMGLTENDISERCQHFLNMSRVYGIILLSGIGYLFYLISQKQWVATIMMLSFNLMMFSFYFRESFWYLQLRERRLGITFKDWVRGIIQ